MPSTLANGCLLSYALDEGTGTPRLNAVGPANYPLMEHGTVPARAGLVGNAAVFNGTVGNFLSLAGYPVVNRGDTDWTWAGWVYFDALTDGMCVLSKRDTGAGPWDFIVLYQALGSYLVPTLGRGDANYYPGSGFGVGTVVVNTWHAVRVYYSHTRGKFGIQIDGNTNEMVIDSVARPMVPSVAKLRFGCSDIGGSTAYGSQPFHGALDNWSLWNRELTAQEWADFRNGGAGLAYPFGGTPAAPPPPIPYRYNLTAGLARWYGARASAAAGPVDVAVVGDSITHGTSSSDNETKSWPSLLNAALQALYGVGSGSGLLPTAAWLGYPFGAPDNYPTQGLVGNPGNARSVAGYGVKGYNYGLTAGTTLEFPKQYGDTFDVFALDGPDTAPFTVQVGSDTPVAVGATQGSYGFNRYRVTTGLGTHGVTVNGTTTGGAYAQLVGISSRVGAAGVVVHNCGIGGANSDDMAGLTTKLSWMAALPAVKLVVFALGTNDWGQQVPVATYKATMAAAIQYAQGMASAPSVLLIAPPPGFSTPAIPLPAYVAALYQLADQYGCALVDIYALFVSGPSFQEDGWNNGADNLHPNDTGYQVYARAVATALTASGPVPPPPSVGVDPSPIAPWYQLPSVKGRPASSLRPWKRSR